MSNENIHKKEGGSYYVVSANKTIFKSFITSSFNYCPLTWHFYSQASTHKMEKY